MGKKSEESEPETPNSPPSDNIFKSLFGTTDQEPHDSIFSDSNPYESLNLQHILQLDVDSPRKFDTQVPDLSIKRKRKDKLPHNDSDVELGRKKLKGVNENKSGVVSERSRTVNEQLSIKRKRKEKLPHGFDTDDSDVESGRKKSKGENENENQNGSSRTVDEKKKKRKRVEVEAEYKERKYGDTVKEKIGEKRKEFGKQDLVARESFDDEEKLSRTVFVRNLPLKVKKKVLMTEFSQFGDVESVRICSIPLLDDKTPKKGAVMKKKINDAVDRVNAYIVFKTEDSAKASLSYNMAVVGGNHIHVDRACPPRKKLKGENAPICDSKRTVFIGNLPFDVKDEELYQLFAGFNNLKDCVKAIWVVRDPGTSMGKGTAYVLFTTREAANTVVRKHKLKIRDRELRLSHAVKSAPSNSKPSKRKESPSAENYSSSKKAAVGGNTSYQGIRATKSGGQKKFATRIARPGGNESRSENAAKRKVRSEKRPAVTARKAAANASATGGGVKRKAQSRTLQSNSRNKKPRKLR